MYLKNFFIPIFSQKKSNLSFMKKINKIILNNALIKNLNIFAWLYCLNISGFLLYHFYNEHEKPTALQEHVQACGAGFSENAQGSLYAAYKLTTANGKISAHGKKISQAIIFSQLPESDRLKGYEDYIHCLKERLNLK